MRFLWPNQLNPNPTGLTRFGRVLHWLGATLAIAVLIIAGLMAHYYLTTPYYTLDGPEYAFGWASGLGVVALAIYFVGRALRYIISGE